MYYANLLYISLIGFAIIIFSCKKKYSALLMLIFLVFLFSNKKNFEKFSSIDENNKIKTVLQMVKSKNITTNNMKVLNNAFIVNYLFNDNNLYYKQTGNMTGNYANINNVKIGDNSCGNNCITSELPVVIDGITINNFSQPFNY